MSQNRQDFDITQGAAKTLNFTLLNGTAPVDLTGLSLRWRLAPAIDADAILEKLNSGPTPGITIISPTTGQCAVAIADSDVDDYGLFWHIMDANINGGWTCLATGRVVVNPGIGSVEA